MGKVFQAPVNDGATNAVSLCLVNSSTESSPVWGGEAERIVGWKRNREISRGLKEKA